MASTEQTAGRGKKLCGGCNTYVGVRTKLCVCGHMFASAKVKKNAKYIESPRKTPTNPLDEPRTNLFNSSGRIVTSIAVPAGECPSPLPKDITLESIRDWAESIQKPFEARNQILLPSAIKYFARTQFVDIRHKNLKIIEGLLDEILVPEEEKGIVE